MFSTFALSLENRLVSTAAATILLALIARLLYAAYSTSEPATSRGASVKSTTRALPSEWYTSPNVYELERRAIFSKHWMLVTHKLRFQENGTWIRFEEAGFQFFLVKNNQGHIRGFHNICRHRAFPIVTKEKGQSHVLSCQYHGWSYGLNGQLAKAPGFTDMNGFDKSKNGLFPVHVHIDAKGFIWVNLDASEKPEPFAQEFRNIDQMSRHEPFDFKDYHFDHTWGMSGDYNWKTLADNYNECYHCKTAHPDVKDLANLESYKVETRGGNIEHFASTNERQAAAGMTVVSNYYFPNACMSVTPNFFYIMRCVPTSATHCSMEYEVYRHRNATDEDFKAIDEMFKRILSEDKWLCNNAQKNLSAGVFINGEMHPRLEKGPLYFQTRVRESLTRHAKAEKAAKREIKPAQQILPRGAAATEQDLGLCHDMGCNNKELDW